MNDNELREWMQRPVEVPALVQKKKENAIARIREDAEAKREDGSVFFQGQKRKKLWKKASLMVAAALAIFVIACAAESNWGQFLVEMMRVTEEQQSFLEKEGFANTPNVSAECNGVTVTVRSTITDSYRAWIDLKIEGYDVPEGETPAFRIVGTRENWEDQKPFGMLGIWEDQELIGTIDRGRFLNDHSYQRQFTSLWMLPSDLKPSDLEGFSVGVLEDKSVSYVTEEGCMEYLMYMETTRPGGLVGLEIYLTLEDLGSTDLSVPGNLEGLFDVSSEHTVQGTWNLHFQLAGNDSRRKVEIALPYDGLGYQIINVEIAPLSMALDFVMEKYYRKVNVIGIRLKNGTVVATESGMITVPEDNLYARNELIYFAGVVDPEQVDAILVKDERLNADNDLGYLIFPVE